MSDIPVWACEYFPLTGEPGGAADLQALTVGAKFGLKCHGDIPVQWDQAPAHLAYAKPEDTHFLDILKVVRQDPNDVQYIVTSYKPGSHEPDYIRVLQGASGSEKGFEWTKPKWQVQSVVDPKQQPPQAYAPFGPWQLSLPLWFLLSVGIAAVLVIYLVARKIRKMAQRRRMLEDLKRHKTALPPLHQFYRDARQIRRRLHALKDPGDLKAITEDLDREFRLFVLRQFQIPALDWSNRAILEDLRRRHRKTYRGAAAPLKKTLRELGKLKSRSQMGIEDVEQLHTMSLDTAEKLESAGGLK